MNKQMVSAAILAGGRGTRLATVVRDLPKVLAPVGGRPFVTYILDQLGEAGFERVALLTGHRAEEVRHTLSSAWRGVHLDYSEETTPLGTGGSLAHALPALIGDTILLLNGDSSCEVDVSALVSFHRRRHSGVTLTVAHVADSGRFGQVCATPDGQVTAFAEKQADGGPGWINAGVYVFERRLVEEIPKTACSLENDLLTRWVQQGCVHAFRGARFLDIGTPESYALAADFLQRERGSERRTQLPERFARAKRTTSGRRHAHS